MKVEVGEGGEGANWRTSPFHFLFQWEMASAFYLECLQSSLLDVHLDAAQYAQPQLNGTVVYDSVGAAEMQLVKPDTILLREPVINSHIPSFNSIDFPQNCRWIKA